MLQDKHFEDSMNRDVLIDAVNREAKFKVGAFEAQMEAEHDRRALADSIKEVELTKKKESELFKITEEAEQKKLALFAHQAQQRIEILALQDKAQQATLTEMKLNMREAATVANSVGDALAGIAMHTKKAGGALKEMAMTGTRAVLDLAIKSIEAYAVSAAGAAYFSQAGIPIIGPIIGVGAAAAAGAFVIGLLANLPSAAGGLGQVPHDTMAFIHRDETVLPAYIAQPMREMFADGGGGTGGGVTININSTYADAAGLQRMAQHPDFLRGLRSAQRNNR